MRATRVALALLAGAAIAGGGFGLASDSGEGPTLLRFVDGTSTSGLAFQHQPFRTEQRLTPEIMGSGVALADFNRDGAVDIVLVNSGRLDGTRPAGSENRLFLNLGDGRFEDRTTQWRLPSSGYGMGVATGDFDNDGRVDLYLTNFGAADVLLRNEGDHFVDVTRSAGLGRDTAWSSSAGFFDLENDGDLDLWVVRYLDYEPEAALPCFLNRLRVYCSPVRDRGLADQLFLNDGNGTFSDVSDRIGGRGALRKGLALLLADIDVDGDMDVYVANDLTPNELWLADGAGRFEEIGLAAGAAVDEFGSELAGMGVDLSDVDSSGLPDLAVSNFQDETTSIYLQAPRALFREVSDAIGVGMTARARLSFGIDFLDADNDGDEDLLVANGHLHDNLGVVYRSTTFEQSNTLYESIGPARFRDVTEAAGDAFSVRQVSRGLATGDLDGDGDLDFVVSNNGGPAQIGRNESVGMGNFVSLWLEGKRANRSAIGARVEARIGARALVRQIYGSSSYLSMNDPRVHLGLGDAEQIDELVIHWPGGSTQAVSSLEAGRHYRIVEGSRPTIYRPGTSVQPLP